MFSTSDPVILKEITEEAVKSTGMGIHRQKITGKGEHGPEKKTSLVSVTTESPSQLREKFAEMLQVLSEIGLRIPYRLYIRVHLSLVPMPCINHAASTVDFTIRRRLHD